VGVKRAAPSLSGRRATRRPCWEPWVPEGASALHYALAFAEAGYKVAPLRGSETRRRNKSTTASRDPEQIEKWFSNGRYLGVALFIDLEDTYTAAQHHLTPGPFTTKYASVLARHESGM